MPYSSILTLAILLLTNSPILTHALSPLHLLPKRKPYPFNQIVAFGDELSDNGNGSYAHGITGNPAKVYGFGTWTDGAVAISYLASLLGVPLVDYAWGGSNGGGSGGATLDNSYTPASAQWNGSPVPSVQQQIHSNYTAAGSPALANIASALQFIWVGENDLSKHTNAFYLGDPINEQFASNISSRLLADAEYLVQKGAPYVLVANVYPKERAPVTHKYLCPDDKCVDTWGKIIQNANAKIQAALKGSKYSKKLIYYDVYSFMVKVMNNKDSYGLTVPLTWFCDGQNDANFTACISGSYTWQGATKYYWMNFIQPTTTVHELIARDMKATIDAFLASS